MNVFKAIVILAGLASMSGAISFKEVVEEEWNEWKTLHGKEYKTKEEDYSRQKIFMDNKAFVARHNALFHQGNKSYTVKINHFADKLPKELNAMHGFKRPQNQNKNEGLSYVAPANVDLPLEVDWRNDGAVTEVKDQGECGSCWAFAATGALEGQHFRKTGRLESLSEQQLVDCFGGVAGNPGHDGCEGGYINDAFRYIKLNGGIDTESSYPYHPYMSETCHFHSNNVAATDKGYVDLPMGDEEALKSAVATIGPIAVAIYVPEGKSFQNYNGGVYDEADLCADSLNHGVLVVGYGTDDSNEIIGGMKDFWIVKNSWGAEWGDEGYIRMARNKKNQCGIASLASYPVV